jgi:iron(III) transport system substrate-binding protein
VPRDYALLMSRIAIIPAGARHPNTAKLFLDYLLSREGQSFLLAQHMAPVRTDMTLPARMQVDAQSSRAIRVGPTLLIHQDRLTRTKFLRDWSKALRGK